MNRKSFIAASALLMLTACSKSEFGFEAADKYAEAVIQNASENMGASGTMRIAENEMVIISPDLQKGEVNVMFKDRTGNIELSETISGNSYSTYNIDPGEYSVSMTALQKTTGTVAVVILNQDEYDEQSFDLKQVLETAAEQN